MSESDEELPLAARRQAVQQKPAPAAPKIKTEQKSPAPAARVKTEVLDDDIPLIQKKVPKKKEAPAKAAPPSKSKVQVIEAPPKSASGRRNSSKVKKEEDKVKREKKEFDMPGQTRETPPETDPLRKFYTSLLSQLPDSEMARKWCAQHGLLERDEAERWIEESKLKKTGAALKSPAKPVPSRSSSQNNGTVKAKAVSKPSSSQPSSRVAIKPEANGKSSSASTKRALDESDDDRPLAKKAKPPPRSAAIKTKRIIDDEDDSENEPLVMKKTSRSAPAGRNGNAPAAAKPAPSQPAAPAKPPPPPAQKVVPKVEAGEESSDEDLPLVQRRHQTATTS